MKKSWLPILIIILIVLVMTGRYLMYGVPHEFLSGELKCAFEGNYDFTMELVNSIRRYQALPLWSQVYSGPNFVFTSNIQIIGKALLYFLTHNHPLAVKIYQVIFFMLSGIGMYLLANYLYKSRFTALFCSIIYMFTPFFIGEMLSFITYTTTYFCLPLAYYFIFKALDSEEYIFYGLISSLIITLNALGHPQNIFIGGLFYFLFGSGVLLYRFFKKSGFIRAIKVFSLIAAAVILLLSFFLLPTLIDGHPYERSLTESGSLINFANFRIPGLHSRLHSQSLLTSLTLLHWPWFITPLKSKVYPPLLFMVIYLLPFILAVWGLFRTKFCRDEQFRPRAMLFLALGLVSLNFAMGTALQSLGLFNWAAKFLPYFYMARAPYRYYYQGVLSICLFSGLVLYKLPKARAAVLFLTVSAAYLFAADYYGNRYAWTFIPSEEPRYVSQVQDWLKINNAQGYRVIETYGTATYMSIDQRALPNGLDIMLKNINKDYLDKYLGLFGFKYILAPRLHCMRGRTFDCPGYMPPRADDGYDDPDDDEEYYSALASEFLFVSDRLKNDPNFVFHSANTRDVAIFENKSAFENYRLYPAQGIMILGGSNAYDFIDLDRYNKYFEKTGPLRVAPVFIAQSKNLKEIAKIKKASRELVFHNTDLIDLYFLMNQGRLIFLSELKNPEWYFFVDALAVFQPFPREDHSLGNFVSGDLSFSNHSIFAKEQGSICDIPVRVDKKDRYALFLRVYGAGGFSNLNIYLGDKPLKGLDPESFRGFHWILLGEGDLEPGIYSLRVETAEAAPAILDAAALVSLSEFNSGLDSVYKDFNGFPITYIIGRRNIIRADIAAGADIYIPETGDFDAVLRLQPKAQAKGKLSLKVDSKTACYAEYVLLPGQPANINFNKVNISRGRHTFTIENIPQDAQLEFIAISKTGQTGPQLPDAGMNYSFDAFSDYRGRIKSDAPLVLVQTEVNYPGWKMIIGREAVRPIITNMFLNGYILDKPQDANFRIYYLNPRQMTGIVISLSALILLIYLVIRFRPRKQK